MANIRTLVWNSNGESSDKAAILARTLGHLEQQFGWQPDVVLIQEANLRAAGAIEDLLSRSGAFQTPVQKTPEGGSQGRAYLMAVAHHVVVQHRLRSYPLLEDPWVDRWINDTFSPLHRRQVRQEIAGFRHLAIAELSIHGRPVRLACWHAPRGASLLGAAPNHLNGGANPDAFLTFAVSELADLLKRPIAGGVSFLAGDLNVQQTALHQRIHLADGATFEVLEGWRGFGQGLDYVAVPPVFAGTIDGFHFDGFPSDHPIIGASLS